MCNTRSACAFGESCVECEARFEVFSLPSQEVIDLCLDMLRSADATASSKEEGSMLQDLEGQCRQMRPLVEAKIASLER